MGEKNKISSDVDLPGGGSVPDQPADETLEKPEIVLTPEQQVAKEELTGCLNPQSIGNKIDFTRAITIIDKGLLPGEVIQLSVKNKIIDCLNKGSVFTAKKIIDALSVTDETLLLPDVQQAVLEHVTICVGHGPEYFKGVIENRDTFHMSEQSFQQAIIGGFTSCLPGRANRALDIKNHFHLPEEAAKKAVMDVLTETLARGSIREFYDIKKYFHLSDDTHLLPEIQQAAMRGLAETLKNTGNMHIGLDMIREFNLPKDDVQSVALKEFSDHLEKGGSTSDENTKKIKDAFLLTDGMVEQAGRKAMARSLSGGKIENAFRIKTELSLASDPKDFQEQDDLLEGEIKATELIEYVKFIGNDDFANLLPKTLEKARTMILENIHDDVNLADYFLEKLGGFYNQPWAAKSLPKAISHFSVAQKFIAEAESDQTIWKDEPWVKDVLLVAEKVIQEHEDRDKEGLKEFDPYENDPMRFTADQAKKAAIVAQIFEGNVDEKKAMELGIDVEALRPILKNLYDVLTGETLGDYAMSKIKDNARLDDEDKAAITESKCGSVEMRPLVSVMRDLLARYLVQSLGDVNILLDDKKIREFLEKMDYDTGGGRMYDPARDGERTYEELVGPNGTYENVIREVCNQGFNKFTTALEIDVPLYDKLYEEFDDLRETGRSPLEVYLGRDGIYAYIGRRAQDVARRRKMGLEGREKQRKMGEVIEIHPQYTVYPRYFRDNLSYDVRRQFLEQEGITPDADPLFYDTGYTGTIPEQMMRIMDFDEADIERRIRLLSAPSPHRRVKGISENARDDIVEYIEHNSKIEEAAEGLVMDKRTGKIRPIAKPTSPEEQFSFMMVKQAMARHYWLKEKLHHEPSGNVNLDSEHYTIRIRQDYAKLLPEGFLKDPRIFFAEKGELLKGSKGEGKYPDEEVVLFRLQDGTEIVAKRVELRKAKEARKEFSILIAAKKAGLPTADPVGFLSGKEEKDPSYLLMGKVEGVSGRNFERHMMESGKYTAEQVREMMKIIAQKNKEMAELFRETLQIDKRWRIKDTIIEIDESTGEIKNVIPIDWERAGNYNPNSPKEIDEIVEHA